MRKTFSLASIAWLPLLACGGSSNNNKTVHTVDSKTFMDGSGSTACTAASSYASLGNLGAAVDHPATGSAAQYQTLYSTVGSADAIVALFEAGGTKWPQMVAPGTFTIDATDGDLGTCDLCFLLSPGGWDMTAMTLGVKDLTDVYIATAGTVTITATGTAGSGSGHQLLGTVSNLQLKHVSIDTTSGVQTDLPDGCTTSIGSGGFGYDLHAPSGSAAAADAPRSAVSDLIERAQLSNRHY